MPISFASGSWLTARRLRAHGLLLAVAIWGVYIWTIASPGLRDRNGNLKGTDFLHFYTLGSLAVEHRGAALYDMNAQAAVVARRVPEAEGIRYLPLYPPQVSLLFIPLAHLPYAGALALWWIVSVVLYLGSCYGVWLICPHLRKYRGTVAVLGLGFPAFFHLIAWGQTSALALSCFAAAFACLRKQRAFWAGVLLGLLVLKPQLAIASAVVLLSLGAWRVVAGAVVGTVTELSIGILYYGLDPFFTWIHTLWNVRHVADALEPRPYQTHCLRTFWSMLVPWSSVSLGLYAITALVVLVWTIQVWRRSSDWAPRFSLLLLSTVLVSPHLTVYDLVILTPAFLLLADWLLSRKPSCGASSMGVLVYLVYLLPLVGFVSRWTHVQVSVVAMMILAYLIWKATRGAQSVQNPSLAETAGVAEV